ncbi:MAG: hypothetical protein ACRBB0_01420 [Pelagimonas sp.]|uniref:hypothetical protein n=1 Tax=Pelagimonas sp. TaxID=2073170 RepID=UPI003D6B8416
MTNKVNAISVESQDNCDDDGWLHDAEIRGDTSLDLDNLLDQKFVFMTGEVYPETPRRNTRDGDWKRQELSLNHWINGDKKSWGLAVHPEAASKHGPSICPSENIDGARKDTAVKTMYAIVTDHDAGASMEDTIQNLEAAGVFAFVYSTFNHLTTRLELKHDDVMRKLALKASPDLAQIKEYLRLHHATRYDSEFIDAVEIEDARTQTKDGLRIILKVPAIDKFRVVLPLAEPVELADLAPTLAGWKDIWADKVTGVCRNILKAEFDVSSTDINRCFFTPRSPKGAEFYNCIVMGKPLRFEDIVPVSKAEYIKGRQPQGDPFLAGGSEGGEVERFLMPESGRSLNRWHHEHKHRFLIADLIEAHAADKVRNVGGERDSTIHIECPFEHEHSTSGGSGTMVMNPHANEHEVWSVFCHHDACKGRHKLEFLQQMLEDEWFDEDAIYDEEFVLIDDEETPLTVTTDKVKSQVAGLSKDSSDDDVKAHIARLIKDGADTSSLNRAKTEIADVTALGKRDVDRMIKTIHAETRASQPAKKSDAINVSDGYMPVIAATIEKLITANADEPLLFSLAEQLTEVRNGRLKPLPVDPLTEVIARVVQFEKTQKMGDNYVDVSTAPPLDVVKNIAHRPHDDFALPLRGVVTSPFFTAGGMLVTEPGYHADAQVYYDPPQGFVLADVPTTPTKKQATDSAHYIIEQVLADFPLGGLNRKEIMARYHEGEGVPALANVLGLILLTFLRDMVDGPTPMHLFNKPSPGTGAGLITKVCHLIATGKPAPATPFPKKDDEAPKTLTSLLCSGIGWVNFDNVAHTIDCPELATALTEPVYLARPLGRTDTVEVEVRNVWSMTAIHSNLSAELARRTVLIDLDAQSAEPEKRTGWLHDDLPAFVIKDRAKLVQCCLTIIQYWISQGKKPYTDVVMGSYERYTAIIGGVLESVGVRGFLGNAQKLKEDTANEDAATLNLFLVELATYPEGEKFRAGQLMEILNKGCAETANEPIMINRLGYSKVDGTYKDPAKIGRWFSKIAKKPWIVRDGSEKIEVSFEEQYDKSTKSNRYVMTKEVLSNETA